MEWNWEEFEHGPVEASSKRLHVTIDRRGHLFLNRHAIEAMGEPDAVTLMYDRRRSTIGLKRSPLGKPKCVSAKTKKQDQRTDHLHLTLLPQLLDLPRRNPRLHRRQSRRWDPDP
jgi:hypothetical protein